jgi:hypothetical protein
MVSEQAWVSDGDGWGVLQAMAASGGSAASASPRSLARPDAAARDLADAVHLLCALHGSYPGLIEQALLAHTDDDATAWLDAAATGFATERAFLARLAAAAGPIPSTPGQAETESAIATQRHALDMLASSARKGCAIGAAIALTLDWGVIRETLLAAATRTGVTADPPELPGERDTALLAARYGATPALRRAMQFGAEQLLVQQRGLWDLAAARQSARRG